MGKVKTFEVLDEALLSSLKKNRNTIIGKKKFEGKLIELYNIMNHKNIEAFDNVDAYEKMFNEYNRLLNEKVGRCVSITDFPATCLGSVDCMRFDII